MPGADRSAACSGTESAHLEGAAKAFEKARAVYADAMAAVTENNLSHVDRLLGGPAPARRHDTEGEGAERPAAHGRPAKPGKKRRRRG